MKAAKELKKAGYRIVSRRRRTASRVDREDWEEFSGNSSPDFYRRVYSKDTIQVPDSYMKQIGSSCHDPIAYVKIS